MNDHASLERIKSRPIFAAIQAPTADSALKAAEAAIAGGLRLIEVRLTTPGAYRVISDLRREHADAVLVGAGSIVSTDMADRAIKAGAQFICCPHTDERILEMCSLRNLLYIAGALTPTEVARAWMLGAQIVNVYPAVPFGGDAYIKMLSESFPDIRVMPSGGVSSDNLRAHLRAGSFAVSIGAGLFSAADIQAGNYSKITERASSLVRIYVNFTNG